MSNSTEMNTLIQIIKRRHLLAWAGTWLAIMLLSWVAIALLLSPNPRNQQNLQLANNQEESLDIGPQKATSQRSRRPDNPHLAFWAFGMVAVTCGYCSILLGQQIKASSRR